MNGFDPDGVEAERICVVPKSVEEEYFSESEKVHPWPWYVYGRAFFEGVGAEFREIEGQLQMLLDEVVYEVDEFAPCSMRKMYTVGRRAIHRFEEIPEFKDIDKEYKDANYFGSIAPFVHQMLGRCLVRCQEIEKNLSNSFIFCAPQKNKPEGKTISDLQAEWKRLTFGQLVKMIKNDWEMVPEVEGALDLFKNSRNLFVHRLCTDPRYDISTRWGVMEFLPFLQFFDLQTKIVMRASEASVAASISLALHRFGAPEGFNSELLDDEHDERVALFFETFWIKGGPWPKSEEDTESV
ncbi:hypothetical protein ACC808_20155 [Rhizobium ruizarguesonis]|jgi:hypothetical protein